MWKIICHSVVGTAHLSDDSPCQDFCLARRFGSPKGEIVLMAASDGAGTAAHSAFAARRTCESISKFATTMLSSPDSSLSDINKQVIVGWINSIRDELQEEATKRDAPIREFACTLLLAILGPKSSIFAQIGDGVIIRGTGQTYDHVFWPQSGTYPQATFFVTDVNFEENLHLYSGSRTDEIAVMSDGLQGIALNQEEKRVRPIFMRELFMPLRKATTPEEVKKLDNPMRKFLASPKITSFTDDDKTLMLATRFGAAPTAAGLKKNDATPPPTSGA